jgi:inhibitor of cysteine peptidase
MEKQKMVIVGVVLVVILAVATLSFLMAPPVEENNLQKFSSYGDLKASFESARNQGRSGGFPLMDLFGGQVMTGAAPEMAMNDSAAKSGSDDFSTTNVQVEGVDEADILKTDGKYAYLVSGNNVFIVDAYPGENMEIISKISFEEDEIPTEIFITDNKLLVFTRTGYSYYYYSKKSSETKCADGVKCVPEFGRNGIVSAKLYNIVDRANPTLEKNVELEGSYVSSRLIGDNAYYVVNAQPRYEPYWDGNVYVYDSNDPIIPLQRIDGGVSKIAEATEIGYIPGVPAQRFVTVAALNLNTKVLNKEIVAASGQSVYASKSNLYLAERLYNRPVPMPIFSSVFSSNWNNTEKTSIAKFKLDNGNVSFVSEGAVPGKILNQFSMDEHKGNFRIATTVGWNGYNNVYVLDKDMNTIGRLEGLAPGESIYSSRFMGDKGYIVTFKKVDPLFVLDLSNPIDPRVLGKLKIPGYSDYLHPIDENHLIGLGKDAIASEYGDFAWYQGIKMAIFDVSDVNNPIELHKTIIGDRGTDSYALRDHRAFLFDKEKELLVIPVTLAEISSVDKEKSEEEVGRWPQYGEYTFQGAMIFNVNNTTGFTERGRVTHITKEDELKRGYYYGDNYSVKRAFYIAENLYTFSSSMLKVNNLASLGEVSNVTFPVEDNYGVYPGEVMIN